MWSKVGCWFLSLALRRCSTLPQHAIGNPLTRRNISGYRKTVLWEWSFPTTAREGLIAPTAKGAMRLLAVGVCIKRPTE